MSRVQLFIRFFSWKIFYVKGLQLSETPKIRIITPSLWPRGGVRNWAWYFSHRSLLITINRVGQRNTAQILSVKWQFRNLDRNTSSWFLNILPFQDSLEAKLAVHDVSSLRETLMWGNYSRMTCERNASSYFSCITC